MVSTAFKSASDLVALCVVIVLFVIFSALFGMHMFGGRCETCTGVSSRYLYSLQDPEYSTMCAKRVQPIHRSATELSCGSGIRGETSRPSALR